MLKLGVLVRLTKDVDMMAEFQKIADMGLQSCQISVWENELYTEENAAIINEAQEKSGVRVSTLWAGWSGPKEWNFTYGPVTLGLVPAAYRGQRLAELEGAIPFAEAIGTKNIATHVGFLPENPNDPDYVGTVGALRKLCRAMKEKGLSFLFETGQETPVTLVRAIEDIGLENVGINFDTGNLVLYGKANPVDAFGIFGKYVMDMHIKDGLYPTDGKNLGKETPVGEGKVDFEALVKLLKEGDYQGYLTIEREISGEKQISDIIRARDLIRELEQKF
ncbi:MAG: sugar phosphate isomerase/epimerase [Ruminococcaceae bacterium]|nr:sugar phosphate isomerase/epimerase [Oscillospiraceae bacterium]